MVGYDAETKVSNQITYFVLIKRKQNRYVMNDVEGWNFFSVCQ